MAIVTSETGRGFHGLEPVGRVIHNPSTSQLYTAAIERGDGRLAEGGPLAVDTGRFTGRSPQDKFVVDEEGSRDRIWWGASTTRSTRNTSTGFAPRSSPI